MPAIVALTNGSPHAWIVINAVVAHFGPITSSRKTRNPDGNWPVAASSGTGHSRGRAIRDALEGTLGPFRHGFPFQLLYHPTLWSYVRTGLSSGIW